MPTTEIELIDIKNRQVCKIGNKLIEAKYKLTLEEQRLILLTIAQVDKDDEDFKTYKIDLKNMSEKVDKKINKTRMKDLAFAIMKKPFMLPETKKIYNFFSAIEPIEKESALKVQFHPDLKPFLLNLKKEFTKYSLENLLNLQSIYAIRIYQLLKQYEQIGSRKFNVDELREILQTPKSYKNFTDFKRKVLDISEKEINTKTDIKIEWEVTKKNRRKVVEIEFKIEKKFNENQKKSKEKQIENINQDIANKKQKELQNNLKDIDDFKLFRTKIIKDFKDKIIYFDNENFSISGVYLALNDKILDPKKALDKWIKLFNNKDKLEIYNKEQWEEKNQSKKDEIINNIHNINNKSFYQIIDYGDFKDEFEYKLVQINYFIIENEKIDTIDFQIKLTENSIDSSKDIKAAVMLQMVEDINNKFNITASLKTLADKNKFELDIENNKLEWL